MLPRNPNNKARGARYANAIKLCAETTVIFKRHNVAHAKMRHLGCTEKQPPALFSAALVKTGQDSTIGINTKNQ
jgi:hypothetical protein